MSLNSFPDKKRRTTWKEALRTFFLTIPGAFLFVIAWMWLFGSGIDHWKAIQLTLAISLAYALVPMIFKFKAKYP